MFRILLMICLATMTCGASLAQGDVAPPERPFTLLLITPGGTQTNMSDPREQTLRSWIYQPQTEQMRRWATWATPKELAATSPIVREHHSDILRDAQTLPALALVDSMNGSRWLLLSGSSMPRTEYELARQLDVYFAATMEAARATPQNAVQSIPRNQYHSSRSGVMQASGPLPFRPLNTDGILPDINLPAFPDSFDANAQVKVDGETRAWASWIMAAIVFCFVVGCCVFIGVAWLICEAFTNQPDQS